MENFTPPTHSDSFNRVISLVAYKTFAIRKFPQATRSASMEENAANPSSVNETMLSFAEEANLDGNSILSTPDKIEMDYMSSMNKLTRSGLSVLSEVDQIDILNSSAKTLHKTISDYVGENFGSNLDTHILAQCSYDYSPSSKQRLGRDFGRISMRQKPTQSPQKDQPKPPKECPIRICRPDYKPPQERKRSRSLSEDSGKKRIIPFKATRRKFQFKPSSLTIVDPQTIRVRKIHRVCAKPTPSKNEVKANKSSKLRYEFARKQGTVPSHMQTHMNKFRKPPFKGVWVRDQCFDNIVDRLLRLKKLVPQVVASPQGSAKSNESGGGAKDRKSRKAKKSKQ